MPFARLPCPCVCALISPGWSSLPAASTGFAEAGAARPGAPISRIVSPSIRMSAVSAAWRLMSTTRPPRTIVVSAMTLSSGRDGGGARRPREEHALGEDDELEEHDAHQREQDDRAEGERQLEERHRGGDEIAEALVGGNELADDRADDRERHRHL